MPPELAKTKTLTCACMTSLGVSAYNGRETKSCPGSVLRAGKRNGKKKPLGWQRSITEVRAVFVCCKGVYLDLQFMHILYDLL